METITLFQWGPRNVLAGSIETVPADPVPPQSTPAVPPLDIPAGQVAVWAGGGWVVAVDPGKPLVPPEPVPFSVSSRQGQLELLEAGYLDAVERAINEMTDPIEKRIAQIEFGATMWERSNPFLQSMWASLGGDCAGLDDLFRRAIKR